MNLLLETQINGFLKCDAVLRVAEKLENHGKLIKPFIPLADERDGRMDRGAGGTMMRVRSPMLGCEVLISLDLGKY